MFQQQQKKPSCSTSQVLLTVDPEIKCTANIATPDVGKRCSQKLPVANVCSSSEGVFGFPPGFLGISHITKTYLHTWVPHDMIFKRESEKNLIL